MAFICGLCNATASNVFDFRDHFSTHTGEFAYQCAYCPFSAAHSSAVENHTICNHPRRAVKVTAVGHSKSFPDDENLKGYACERCGLIQICRKNVEQHVAIVEMPCSGASILELELCNFKPLRDVSQECEQLFSEEPGDVCSSLATETRNTPIENSSVNRTISSSSELECNDHGLARGSVQSETSPVTKLVDMKSKKNEIFPHTNAAISVSKKRKRCGEYLETSLLSENGDNFRDETERNASLSSFSKFQKREKLKLLMVKLRRCDSHYSHTEFSDHCMVSGISEPIGHKENDSSKSNLPEGTENPERNTSISEFSKFQKRQKCISEPIGHKENDSSKSNLPEGTENPERNTSISEFSKFQKRQKCISEPIGHKENDSSKSNLPEGTENPERNTSISEFSKFQKRQKCISEPIGHKENDSSKSNLPEGTENPERNTSISEFSKFQKRQKCISEPIGHKENDSSESNLPEGTENPERNTSISEFSKFQKRQKLKVLVVKLQRCDSHCSHTEFSDHCMVSGISEPIGHKENDSSKSNLPEGTENPERNTSISEFSKFQKREKLKVLIVKLQRCDSHYSHTGFSEHCMVSGISEPIEHKENDNSSKSNLPDSTENHRSLKLPQISKSRQINVDENTVIPRRNLCGNSESLKANLCGNIGSPKRDHSGNTESLRKKLFGSSESTRKSLSGEEKPRIVLTSDPESCKRYLRGNTKTTRRNMPDNAEKINIPGDESSRRNFPESTKHTMRNLPGDAEKMRINLTRDPESPGRNTSGDAECSKSYLHGNIENPKRNVTVNIESPKGNLMPSTERSRRNLPGWIMDSENVGSSTRAHETETQSSEHLPSDQREENTGCITKGNLKPSTERSRRNLPGWIMDSENVGSSTRAHQTETQSSEHPPSDQREENTSCITKGNSTNAGQVSKTFQSSKISEDNETGIKATENVQTLNFPCGLCNFHTRDDEMFKSHYRRDHESELAMWCKNCGRCFNNVAFLVKHIKRGPCEKHEMRYRCAEKKCEYQTTVGHSFLYHLKYFHKESPFIICDSCRKIFSVPSCLILHMQNECRNKMKSRKQTDHSELKKEFVSVNKGINLMVNKSDVLQTTDKVRCKRGGRGIESGGVKYVDSDCSDSDDIDDPKYNKQMPTPAKPISCSGDVKDADQGSFLSGKENVKDVDDQASVFLQKENAKSADQDSFLPRKEGCGNEKQGKIKRAETGTVNYDESIVNDDDAIPKPNDDDAENVKKMNDDHAPYFRHKRKCREKGKTKEQDKEALLFPVKESFRRSGRSKNPNISYVEPHESDDLDDTS